MKGFKRQKGTRQEPQQRTDSREEQVDLVKKDAKSEDVLLENDVLSGKSKSVSRRDLLKLVPESGDWVSCSAAVAWGLC